MHRSGKRCESVRRPGGEDARRIYRYGFLEISSGTVAVLDVLAPLPVPGFAVEGGRAGRVRSFDAAAVGANVGVLTGSVASREADDVAAPLSALTGGGASGSFVSWAARLAERSALAGTRGSGVLVV